MPAALQRARERLAYFRAHPDKHARHAFKALLKYHLMEVQQQPWPVLLHWLQQHALYPHIWQRLGCPGGSFAAFSEQVLHELAGAGVLAVRDGMVLNG